MGSRRRSELLTLQVVQRFGQVAILAVDAGFSKMHFEALAEQIAEDLQANKSQLELFLAQAGFGDS